MEQLLTFLNILTFRVSKVIFFEKFLKRSLKNLVILIYDDRSVLFFFKRNKKIGKSVTFFMFGNNYMSVLAIICALSQL